MSIKISKRNFLWGTASIALANLPMLRTTAFASDRPAVYGKNGMVVAATPGAAQIGQQILSRGGTAVDAVVGTAAAVALLEPNLSSPFGVGYLLYYSPKIGEVRGLEFGGRGPKAMDLAAYKEDTDRRIGGKAVAVPGNIAGWVTLQKEHGTLSVAEVFAPTIELAENGFPLSQGHADILNTLLTRHKYDETKQFYGKSDGTPWQAGDLYKNKGYADTLRAVANEGLEVVYGGRIGQQIVDAVKKYGGVMTLEDLASYKPQWMPPVSTDYRGYKVYTSAPPSSGIQVLGTLNILEGYDIGAMKHDSAERYHLFMEAVNLAATDRDAYVGDPDFVKVPVDLLLSKEHAASRRKMINMAKATTTYPPSRQEGTTHFAVADKWGNVVAVTNTLASGWGSGITAGTTGVLLNNAYAYANTNPKHPGVIGPNRRQAWCLSPMMIFDKDGRFWASVGTPGGETIQQTQTQVISNLIDYGMDPQTAVKKPRFAHEWMGQPSYEHPEFGVLHTSIDAGLAPEIYQQLEQKGHNLQVAKHWGYTGSNAVIQHDAKKGWYIGGADPRRWLYAVGL